MPIGPGKYDDLCTYVREQAEATAAIIMVIDGNKGSGFSVQSPVHIKPATLAALLRTMAEQIEEGKS